MIYFRSRVNRTGTVIQKLQDIQALMQNMVPVFDTYNNRLQKMEYSIFQHMGDAIYGGRGRFRRLSDRYALRRYKEGFTGPILVRTGRLMRSLTRKNSPGAFREIKSNRFQFGSSLKLSDYPSSGRGKRRSKSSLNMLQLHIEGRSGRQGLRGGNMPSRNPEPRIDAMTSEFIHTLINQIHKITK